MVNSKNMTFVMLNNRTVIIVLILRHSLEKYAANLEAIYYLNVQIVCKY